MNANMPTKTVPGAILCRYKLEEWLRKDSPALSPQVARLLQTTLENTSESILWLQSGGRIVYANEAAAQLSGYTREALLGTTIGMLCPQAGEGAWDRWWGDVRRHGITAHEIILARHDGRRHPVGMVLCCFEFEGEPLGCAFLQDTAERRVMEDTMRRRQKELEAVMRALPDLFLCINAEGVITHVRPGGASDIHLTPDTFVEQRIQDLLPPDLAATLDAAIKQVHNGRPSALVEFDLPLGQVVRSFEARLAKVDDAALAAVIRDITGRRHTDRCLREVSQQRKNLFQYSMDALFIIHPDTGLIVEANPAAGELTGRTLEELCGMHYTCLYPAEEKELAVQLFHQGLDRPGGRPRHLYLEHRSGRRIPVSSIPCGLVERDGRSVALCLFRNMTLHRETETALHQAKTRENQLESIMRHGPVMIFRWQNSPDQDFTFVSGNVAQLGYTPEDLLRGQITWRDLLHPQDAAPLQALLAHQSRMRQQDFPMEFRLIDRQGRVRWMSGHARTIAGTGGGITHYEMVALDTTDKINAMHALRENRELLAMALQGAGAAAWSWDIAHDVFWWSDAFWSLIGRDPQEGPPSCALWLSAIDRHDRQAADEYLSRAIALRLPMDFEYRVLRGDGRLSRLRTMGRFVDHPECESPCLVGVTREIVPQQGEDGGAAFASTRKTPEESRGDTRLRQLAQGAARDLEGLLETVRSHTEAALAMAPEGSPLAESLRQIEAATHCGAVISYELAACACAGIRLPVA